MGAPLTVTDRRTIAASPDAVWRVITDPSVQRRLDTRNRVDSVAGPPAEPSVEWELVVRAGIWTRIRMQYVFVEAQPGERLVADVLRRGRKMAEQRAELRATDGGTLLTWTVTQWVGPVTRRLAQGYSRRQLGDFLAAVEREAVGA